MEQDPRVLFGKNLRDFRKTLGLSQEELALESGLDRTYISEVERGKRNISLINICKLAETLGVAPNRLLQFDEVNCV